MQASGMFLFFLSFCTCSELYLGINNSSDVPGCGMSPAFPCATLPYLLSSCHDGDTVIIEEGVYINQGNAILTCENVQIIANGMQERIRQKNKIFDDFPNRKCDISRTQSGNLFSCCCSQEFHSIRTALHSYEL